MGIHVQGTLGESALREKSMGTTAVGVQRRNGASLQMSFILTHREALGDKPPGAGGTGRPSYPVRSVVDTWVGGGCISVLGVLSQRTADWTPSTTETYPLPVWGAGSLRARIQQGCFLLKAKRKDLFQVFLLGL